MSALPSPLHCCKSKIEICMAYAIKAEGLPLLDASWPCIVFWRFFVGFFSNRKTIQADCSQLIAYSSLVPHQ